MKAKWPQVERALKAPAETRLFLFYGPDEGGSRTALAKLAAAVGAEAERVDLSASDLKADPARLADEAAAFSMFGGARWILVEQAGDEIAAAVEALLGAGVAGNPVAVVAGDLKGSSKLVKLATASPLALAYASYTVDARDAAGLVGELGRALGLSLRPDVARRIADSCGGQRALIAQELEKLALYVDASPGAPKPLDMEALDALGTEAEGDLSRLVDSVVGGDAATLDQEVERLRSEGREGITLIRAVLRRMTLLARLRAEMDKGNSASAVMASSAKSMFWKEKDSVQRQLGQWRSDRIARAIGRLVAAERAVMRPGGPGIVAADAELFAICRQAARR